MRQRPLTVDSVEIIGGPTVPIGEPLAETGSTTDWAPYSLPRPIQLP